MCLSSDVPQLLRVAVPWLQVENACGPLPHLEALRDPWLWPQTLMDAYAHPWWKSPGTQPHFINTWDPEYAEDLSRYYRKVSNPGTSTASGRANELSSILVSLTTRPPIKTRFDFIIIRMLNSGVL